MPPPVARFPPSKMTDKARTPVLVTRAEPGASQTTERLAAMGFEPVLSPALELLARDELVPDLDRFGGLVFTSANGVRFFAEATHDRGLPAWCVGPATASEALREGFSPVHESSGDAHDLAHYITHHWSGDARRLLHVANAAAKGNLKKALEAEGFRVTFLPLYEARPASGLSAEAVEALGSGDPVFCLIHSQKGADAYRSLAKGRDLSNTRFVAISAQAARPLEGLKAASVSIASHPDEQHLLDLLQRLHAAG